MISFSDNDGPCYLFKKYTHLITLDLWMLVAIFDFFQFEVHVGTIYINT